MAFFISYPFSALGHDIWTRADKGYDMKNDMLWSVYHILQLRFPEIQEVTCNKLININRKACSNIPEAIINLLYQPAWAILVKLGEINMIPQSYYSKQNSKFYHRVKF